MILLTDEGKVYKKSFLFAVTKQPYKSLLTFFFSSISKKKIFFGPTCAYYSFAIYSIVPISEVNAKFSNLKQYL